MESYRPRDWKERFWYLLAGPMAVLWLLLRSGLNPKRLTYPCQQAALPVAGMWILALLGAVTSSWFFRRFTRLTAAAAGLAGSVWLVATLAGPSSSREVAVGTLPVWESPDPVSRVFVLEQLPPTSGSLAAGDASVPDAHLSDPAIDTLVRMLAAQGIDLHRTASSPDGIVGADHVVVIKGNFQWTHQNVTNNDRIKGLVWQILNHPDGFTGEILICDNTQNVGTTINQDDDNADDPAQSIIDVANTFAAKGHPVSVRDWTPLWGAVTEEYSGGWYNEGYVYESATRINYPKFRSPSGNYISMRYGVWDSLAAAYDADKLCIIDFPVLKQHVMAGATIAVKNWIGLMTTAYPSERYGSWQRMHYVYFWSGYALVARTMAVTFPRLSIVDATWISTNNANDLCCLSNARMLAASTDPVAVSWYAAKYMLTPVATHPEWTNPDVPSALYAATLRNWTNYFADTLGLPCTRDSAAISVYGFDFSEIPCVCSCHGDPQCDGNVNVLDVVRAVNVAFKSAPEILDPDGRCPMATTDVDCSGATNVLDVVRFVNVAFRGGQAEVEFCASCSAGAGG